MSTGRPRWGDDQAPRREAQREGFAWVRAGFQVGFLAFCVLVGLEFSRFVSSLQSPIDRPTASRPASVEAFLPISSLMSLVYFARTGVATRVHPAGLVFFSITLVSVLFVRRGFCSWVCPIGTLSEYAHKTGKRLFGRNLAPPALLDRVLRGIKYAFLCFFLYSILSMSPRELSGFLQGPYNRFADVKMYLFFAHMTPTALLTILSLTAVSLLVENFWCRYLCPYGALLGILSFVSPVGIRRNETLCTGCERCDRVCPNKVQVSGKRFVRSEECTACFRCRDSCPETGALAFGSPTGRVRIPLQWFAMLVLLLFVLLPRLFSALGYWHTDTPPAMYKALYRLEREGGHVH